MATKLEVKRNVLKKGYHYITSDFGKKRTYTNTKGITVTDKHKGVDFISNGDGYDYILAFEAGTVVTAKYLSDTGYFVKINHGNGVYTRYMHMKKDSITVKVGQKVSRGQAIGYMGATGNVTGRHLHFDISINGTYVDPKPYLTLTKALPCAKGPGKYIVTGDVNVRKTAGVTNSNRVYFKDFSKNAQEQVLKIAGKPVDHFPTGMKVDISKVSGTWGKCPTGWISLNYCKERN